MTSCTVTQNETLPVGKVVYLHHTGEGLYIFTSLLPRLIICYPKQDGKINANPSSWQFFYFLLSARSFRFGQVIGAYFHVIIHTLSGLAAGHQSLAPVTITKHKVLFSVFANKLRRSVVAAGEKQATADYRISKRYKLLPILYSYLQQACK